MSCSAFESSSDQTKEVLEDLRSRIYETAPITDETVYWVKGGSVYHLYRDCKFLAKSDDVRYGTAYYSGRTKVCETCAKRAEESRGMTETETELVVERGIPENSGTESTEIDGETVNQSIDSSDPIDSGDNAINDSSLPEDNEQNSDNTGQKNTGTVYWTPGGSVWHVDPKCSALARSSDIRSGTVEQSGKSRGC